MLTTFDKVQNRALALRKTRAFFDSRGFFEVDVKICNKAAAIDCYIDLFEVKDEGFLHSSPELAMKNLLVHGSKNIYFLGHVFRKEENGSLHNSEFTMLEFYHTETTEEAFLQETVDYLSLFLGKKEVEILPYTEAFEKYTPKSVFYPNNCNEKEKRHFLLSHYIEPNLGNGVFTFLTDFPEEEASLAATKVENGKTVAKRYEIFYKGIELGNGFLELDCAKTIQKRFEDANQERVALGKCPYPIDQVFLKNISFGLPKNTYGIALGFDRILSLALNSPSIHNILL
jgi:lysyl-tRNA synthetase class 2